MTFSTKKFLSLSLIGASCFALPANAAQSLIRNSSFEVGMDGYGILRAEYLKTGQKKAPYFAPVLDAKEKAHGDVSLRIDNPNAGSFRFFTKAFPVDPNKQYVFSFMAKAGVPGTDLVVNFQTAEKFYDEVGNSFSIGSEWKRYTTAPMKVPSGRKLCSIQLMYGVLSRLNVGTSLWLDSFQIHEAPDSTYAPRLFEVGIVNVLPRHYTQAKTQNYPVSFKVRNNQIAAADLRVRYQVFDEYFKKVLSTSEVKVPAVKGNSTANIPLANVSPKIRGKFIVKAELLGKDNAVLDRTEMGFAVIDSVKKGPGQFTDAFSVSGHGGQRPGRPMAFDGQHAEVWTMYDTSVDEMFDFRAQAGDRWIRDWDNSCVFNWSNIEPEDGKFEWTVVDNFVEECKQRGIRVLPVLGGVFIIEALDTRVPKWMMDRNPELTATRTMDPRQKVYLPPLDKWERYCREAVKRYKGTITTWEIFNEPNLWITAEQYMVYLKSAYKVIKEEDPTAQVVAFSTSQDYGGKAVQYLEESFKLGALEYCDIVSFHPYGAAMDWSTPQSAEDMNRQVREVMDRAGAKDKPLWSGELYNVNRPDVPNGNWDYAGRTIRGGEAARRYLIDFSTGIDRSMTLPVLNYFELFNPESWATNAHLSGSTIPSTTWVVYNTLTRLFENAKPQGEVKLFGKNKLYLYSKGSAPIAASWSFDWDDNPSQLTIPGGAGKFRILDVMGNPSDQFKTQGKDLVATISNSVLYFLPVKGAEGQFLSLMQKAKASTGAGRALVNANYAFDGDKPVLAVALSNPQSAPMKVDLTASAPSGEFALQLPKGQITIPAGGTQTVRLPLQNKGNWQTAKVDFSAKSGELTANKQIEIKAKPLALAPALKNAVQIDGKIEANEWSEAGKIAIDRPDQVKMGNDVWTGVADTSATGYVKHDAEALYICLHVKDQTRGPVQATNEAYDRDSVELFFDIKPDSNLDQDYFQDGTFQLTGILPTQQGGGVRWVRSSTSGRSLDVDQITSATQLNADGYDIEIKIPWSQLAGFTVAKGGQFGFDVVLNDSDDALHRKAQIVWAGEANNYADRTKYGRLLLQ